MEYLCHCCYHSFLYCMSPLLNITPVQMSPTNATIITLERPSWNLMVFLTSLFLCSPLNALFGEVSDILGGGDIYLNEVLVCSLSSFPPGWGVMNQRVCARMCVLSRGLKRVPVGILSSSHHTSLPTCLRFLEWYEKDRERQNGMDCQEESRTHS